MDALFIFCIILFGILFNIGLAFLTHMIITKKKVCYFFNKKDPVYFSKK